LWPAVVLTVADPAVHHVLGTALESVSAIGARR
jgi:hypothetical protein